MNYLPSKELLSELGYGEVIYIGDIVELYEMQCLAFRCNVTIDSGRDDGKTIITSKFYHIALEVITYKCKEWAMQTPYIVDQLAINIDRTCLPNKFKTRYWCVWLLHYSKVSEEFYADTESEAIFQACQWVLDNRN